MVVPDHLNLFGPHQVTINPFNFVPPTIYGWVGTGSSESSKFFGFTKGYAPCVMARMAVTWAPFGCSIALVQFQTGQVSAPEVIYEKQNNATTPVNDSIEFTSYMNRWIGERVDRHLGFQIKGDGQTGMNLWGVRMEMEYEIGGRR